MSEDTIQRYEIEQQALIDRFKNKLKLALEDVLGSMYCDVSIHADTDAHTNYLNYLKDHFKESLTQEIVDGYSHYSWAHGIRMQLLEKYPEKIGSKIISDLQDKVKSLEDHIEQLRRFR